MHARTFQSMRLRLPLALAAAVVLGGCATFSQDGGFGAVEQAVQQRTGKAVAWTRTADQRDSAAARVGELLAQPLSADAAVQVALLNNRGLQAAFYELGLSEADLVQASRLPNPRFSLLRTRRGEEYKIEQVLGFNVFSLLTLPLAREIELRRFEQTKAAVSGEAVRLAFEARKAYYAAVAAEETVRYMDQVRLAAEAGAQLAQRMARVGNFSKLDQAREQAFYADATAQLARARQRATGAREQLARLLGLDATQIAFRLPERLPDLPQAPEERPDLEALAMQSRLDLQAIRAQLQGVERSLGLTRTTRFINALDFGPARTLEGQRSDSYKNGYEVAFEIPIFDFGTARVARAEAIYMQAVERAAEAAINARSEVREAYSTYRTGYDLARHYRDEIVPLRKRISEENTLRYNGMLIGVFELLADARAQVNSVNSYIETLRDFWVAQSDLEMSLVGRPTGLASIGAPSTAQAGSGTPD